MLLVAALIAVPAAAADCLTEADVEAAVGDQIRSGAFAINTSKMPDKPMCGGITLAATIQKIAARISPRKPVAPPPPPAPVQTATPNAPTVKPRNVQPLLAHVGKHHADKVKGVAFLDHPLMIAGLTDAGVSARVRARMKQYAVASAIRREGDLLVAGGCFPHFCDTDNFNLYVATDTGATALCMLDSEVAPDRAYWYSPANRGKPVILDGPCAEAPDDAPGIIRSALFADRSAAPGAPAPARFASLVGGWTGLDNCENDGGITYEADGSWYAFTEIGTWSLKGTTLTQTTTERGEPEDGMKRLARPERHVSTVTMLTDTDLRYRDAQGETILRRCPDYDEDRD